MCRCPHRREDGGRNQKSIFHNEIVLILRVLSLFRVFQAINAVMALLSLDECASPNYSNTVSHNNIDVNRNKNDHNNGNNNNTDYNQVPLTQICKPAKKVVANFKAKTKFIQGTLFYE